MPNRRFNKQVPGHGYQSGGQVNTSRMNRLEELGRVDAERAGTRTGSRNLKDEKLRIIRELRKKQFKKGGKRKSLGTRRGA